MAILVSGANFRRVDAAFKPYHPVIILESALFMLVEKGPLFQHTCANDGDIEAEYFIVHSVRHGENEQAALNQL